MVQFRRLDPLANAGPYQRLLKNPVKSFTLTSAQFDRVRERRPALLIHEADEAVIGVPTRDLLEIHYAFPSPEAFRDHFGALFERVIDASSHDEVPRGVLLSFRDRPNRGIANTIFWPLALDQGSEWVEMSNHTVPEQPEPDVNLADGFRVREADATDADAIAAVDAVASGLTPLTADGIATLIEDSRWLRIVEDSGGAPAALVTMRTEEGGWGIIQQLAIRPEHSETLGRPLYEWCIAFLRNNRGRRIRRQVYPEDAAELSLLRELGFTPGETGLDFTRSLDAELIRAKLEERQAHGSVIKFGDWR